MDNPWGFPGFQGLVVALGIVSLQSSTDGATLRVPQDYASITAAANVAQQGDSILVWRGPAIDWVDQEINLRQGVILRGMEQIHPFAQMWILDSVINLLESSPIPGVDDTTRVEHFAIDNPPFHETVQTYTPRSSIVESYLWTSGPYDYPMIRIWKGGVIARNYFSGTGESNAIEARQGVNVVAWNYFDALFICFALYNQSAPESATLSFRNNTIRSCEGFFVYLRPESNAELVNNIFRSSREVYCSGAVDIRYNDFYLTTNNPCPQGISNISEDPLTGENGANMGSGGICGVTGIGDQESPSPALRLTVEPNPVWSTAEFGFEGDLETASLAIYDPQGRLVDLLYPSGRTVHWSPTASAAPGVYFARLRGKGISESVKFVVIR